MEGKKGSSDVKGPWEELGALKRRPWWVGEDAKRELS